MSDNGKQQREQSKQVYERMLRGEATPKDYADTLRREAKAERRSIAGRRRRACRSGDRAASAD
jgi:hypothetical protein